MKPQSDEKKPPVITIWIPVIVAIIGCLGTITAALLDPDLFFAVCPACKPSSTASPTAVDSGSDAVEIATTASYILPPPPVVNGTGEYWTPTPAMTLTAVPATSTNALGCVWIPYPPYSKYTQCLNIPERGITSSSQDALTIFMDELFVRKSYGFFRPINAQGKISVRVLISNLVASEFWIGVSASEDPLEQSLMIIFQPNHVVDIRRYANGSPLYLEDNKYIPDLEDTIADPVIIEIIGTRVNCIVDSVSYRSLVSLPFVASRLFIGYQLLPLENSAARIDVKVTEIQDK